MNKILESGSYRVISPSIIINFFIPLKFCSGFHPFGKVISTVILESCQNLSL